jgi:molybdopterin synthase sulfur carrier subunit
VTAVTVRFWAAARDAAGVAEESYVPGNLASITAEAVARHGARLGVVLDRSSFLVDGAPVGKRDHTTVDVPAGAVLEVLPPFAGG